MTAPATTQRDSRDPLSTSHLLTGLGRRTASNVAVTTIAQAARFAISVASTLVLARLLTPKDFGLVAMVTAFTGFLEILKDAGLSTATIQRNDITQGQISNLFWANVAIGLAITCLVIALSPLLAWFYHEPKLVPIAVAVSMTFLVTASTVQHQALLRRQMRFVSIAVIQISAALVGLATGVIMAARGWDYWALVGSLLSTAAVTAIMTWLISRWRPSLPARHIGTRPLLGFGIHLTGAGLVQTVMGTVDTLLIGRVYGPVAVGLYSRGAALLFNPLQQFLSPFHAVMVPTLSRIHDDPARYRRVFLEVLNLVALLALPLAGFLLAAAKPLVLLLLGNQWTAAVPIFAAFSLVAIYSPLASASTWLFTSQGRGKEILTSSTIVSSITLGSIVVGLPFGPFGVALSYSLSGMLMRLPVLFHMAGRRGAVTTRDLWQCLFVNFPYGIFIYATARTGLSVLAPGSDTIRICVLVPLCLAAAAFFILISPLHRRIATHAFDRARTMLVNDSKCATVAPAITAIRSLD